MFAYAAMLVQENIFREINFQFLVVGHTHASIDQYFSVLARKISKAYFLGSPLALEHLIGNNVVDAKLSGTKSEFKSKPLIVKKISVLYNMKAALSHLINPKIRYAFCLL